jgi:hypothetical protein
MTKSRPKQGFFGITTNSRRSDQLRHLSAPRQVGSTNPFSFGLGFVNLALEIPLVVVLLVGGRFLLWAMLPGIEAAWLLMKEAR